MADLINLLRTAAERVDKVRRGLQTVSSPAQDIPLHLVGSPDLATALSEAQGALNECMVAIVRGNEVQPVGAPAASLRRSLRRLRDIERVILEQRLDLSEQIRVAEAGRLARCTACEPMAVAARECPQCYGTGIRRPPCWACGGSGEVHQRRCVECEGTSYWPVGSAELT